MPDLAMLDYFYGDEAEQFTFYRIPKVLFTDPSYRRISSDAKILYGLMLDRMGLSVRNGWLDEYNRVFIFFTLEDALEYLCCGHTKAVSLFGELDKAGLIERKKQGQGKPTKIYVKNFVRNAEVLTSEKRKSILRQYLDTLKGQYSHILIDCQPSLGMLTVNTLAAANRIIIPVQAEYRRIIKAVIYRRKRKGRSLHNRGCDRSLIRKYFLMNGNG